jgi:hypothetical protein
MAEIMNQRILSYTVLITVDVDSDAPEKEIDESMKVVEQSIETQLQKTDYVKGVFSVSDVEVKKTS